MQPAPDLNPGQAFHTEYTTLFVMKDYPAGFFQFSLSFVNINLDFGQVIAVHMIDITGHILTGIPLSIFLIIRNNRRRRRQITQTLTAHA